MPENELGRLLTEEECDWLRDRGFDGGFDVDTESPQLNHICIVRDAVRFDLTEALCGTPHLWGVGLSWGSPRASGDYVEEDRRLKCNECLAKFDQLRIRAKEFHRFSEASSVRRTHGTMMEEIAASMLDTGRPDLALMLEAIRVSYLVDSAMSETTLRHVFVNMLAIKSERINRAMRLLSESDGEH